MSEDTNPPRGTERFTMLEPREPSNLTAEQQGWRVAEVTQSERFTLLPGREPAQLTPEQMHLVEQLAGTIASGHVPVEAVVSALVKRTRELASAGG